MRLRLRWSSFVLAAIFSLLGVLLLLLQDVLLAAHADESILAFASDASVYYAAYERYFSEIDILRSPELALVGSPILFLRLADGNLLWVQGFNLAVMFLALATATRCLQTFQGRLAFVGLSLLFPYFAFGFLGLNKEVYAMSAAIFFGCWLIRGQRRHLLLALLLGACARYYMLIALVALVFTVPRGRAPRWWLAAAMLVAIGAAAPFAKSMIPGYSHEALLEDASGLAILFSSIIDNFGYAVAYPVKYLLLMPTRFYGYAIGSSHDLMGAAASLASMLAFAGGCVVWRRDDDPLVRRMLAAAVLAPVPIMWSEIMHWRYYAFVYFFIVFAIVLHGERSRLRRRADRPLPGTMP